MNIDTGTRIQWIFAFIAGIAWLVAALVFLYGYASAASADPNCLTYKEARAKYPSQHLRWRTTRHCWGNWPPRERTRARNRKPEPIAPQEDEVKEVAVPLTAVRWHIRPFDSAIPVDPPVFLQSAIRDRTALAGAAATFRRSG